VEATDLDLDRFNQALQRLIERHDMLRAILLPDGQQQILEQVPPFEMKIVDLRGQNSQEQASQLDRSDELWTISFYLSSSGPHLSCGSHD